jgi:uncharacterized Fe-S cluster-containing radical SAM superfamily enzyme
VIVEVDGKGKNVEANIDPKGEPVITEIIHAAG